MVVSLSVIAEENKETTELITVSECGYGKRTALDEYPVQGRGGMGVITMKVTDKTGHLVSMDGVLGDEELFVLSEGGVLDSHPRQRGQQLRAQLARGHHHALGRGRPGRLRHHHAGRGEARGAQERRRTHFELTSYLPP